MMQSKERPKQPCFAAASKQLAVVPNATFKHQCVAPARKHHTHAYSMTKQQHNSQFTQNQHASFSMSFGQQIPAAPASARASAAQAAVPSQKCKHTTRSSSIQSLHDHLTEM
jgi:hypothetical protein